MTAAAAQLPKTKPSADGRVIAAVNAIAAAVALKPAQRSQLLAFVDELIAPFPKLPLVSFYPAARGSGGVEWRLTYRVKGHKPRTDRLGSKPKPAYLRAQRVSEILVQVKAGLMKSVDAYRLLYVDNTHVDVDVAAFERSINSKGNVARYNKTTVTRLRRMIALDGIDRIGQISRDRLPDLIDKLRAFVDPETDKPLSESTINDYLAVYRQFTRWATPKRLLVDPLVNSSGIKVTTKKDRRDVLVDEVAAIVVQATASTARYLMTGPDRAMLYLMAYGTGLRANELRQLRVEWVKFEATPQPYIAIPEEVQKKTGRAKDLKHPIPRWLADKLFAWLDGRADGLVFPSMPRDVAPLFDRDREDARAAWIAAATTDAERPDREKSDFLARQTVDGEVVFHSNRHAFSTNALATLDLKTAQRLTRHTTTAMLTDRYSHSRIEQAAEGVEKAIANPMKDG